MRDLLVITPTRGRPDGARRLIGAIAATATLHTELVLCVDDDDPSYADISRDDAEVIRGPRQDVAGWTNTVAAERGGDYRAVASIGDDHVPLTWGWDELLLGALGGRPGVAYGNDLFQCENVPTAVVITTDIVLALGYMCPPGVEHLYIDCFWKRLGEDLRASGVGALEYLSGVIIEHRHPVAGKAEWDESYQRSNASEQYSRDGVAYDAFLSSRWPGDLARLAEQLGGAG